MEEQDFQYEVATVTFPFKKLITGNEGYEKALREDFLKLPLRPKFHWFIKDFIADERYQDALRKDHEALRALNHGNGPAATASSEIDAEVRDLEKAFWDLHANNELHPKYHGRFIKDTNTVKVLEQVGRRIALFKRRVLSNATTDYKAYAKVLADKIVHLADKIELPGFKAGLLGALVEDQDNVELDVEWIAGGRDEREIAPLMDQYLVLKGYADFYLRKEITAAANAPKTLKENAPKPLKRKVKLEEPPFELIFKDEEMPAKLLQILKSDEIGWVDEEEKWEENKKSAAPVLSFLLSKKDVYKKKIPGYSMSLTPTSLHRIFSRRFKDTVGSEQNFTRVFRNCNDAWNESERKIDQEKCSIKKDLLKKAHSAAELTAKKS